MLDFALSLLTEAQKIKFSRLVDRWPSFFTGEEISAFTPEIAEVIGCRTHHVKRNFELISKRLSGRLIYDFPPLDSGMRACDDPLYEEKTKKGGRSHPRLVIFKWKFYK